MNIPLIIEDSAKAKDPVGVENFKKLYSEEIAYCSSIEDTLTDTHIFFVFTECDEVKHFALDKYSQVMKTSIVLDGSNCYNFE